jgi:hypothetical protein
VTDHCVYDNHGLCPDAHKTCSCVCHWEFTPPMTRQQKTAATAFFVIPLILFIMIAWKG